MADKALTEVDFGDIPGNVDTFVDVTGQTGFVNTSLVEAWIQPKDTVDHTVDEHMIEDIKVHGVFQANGTIRIYARSTDGRRLYGRYTVGYVWTN